MPLLPVRRIVDRAEPGDERLRLPGQAPASRGKQGRGACSPCASASRLGRRFRSRCGRAPSVHSGSELALASMGIQHSGLPAAWADRASAACTRDREPLLRARRLGRLDLTDAWIGTAVLREKGHSALKPAAPPNRALAPMGFRPRETRPRTRTSPSQRERQRGAHRAR
jgi:hypothetical protein